MSHPRGTKLLREDEAPLYAKWKRTADKKIRDHFVMSVYGLIVTEAKRQARTVPLEDKINAGIVGACRAFDKFEPTRGTRFNTYAAHWIRAEIGELCNRSRSLLSGTALRFDGSSERNGERLRASAVSLSEAEAELDQKALESESHTALDATSLSERREQLLSLIDKAPLTERERFVLRTRWLGPKGQQTFREVGKKIGLSHERVRQLEASAFDKIKALEASDGSAS